MPNDLRDFLTIVELFCRLDEAQATMRDTDAWGNNYRILKNPTKREMANMAKKYHAYLQEFLLNKGIASADALEAHGVRTIYDNESKDTYAWGALHNTHFDLARVLGLSDYDKGSVSYDPKTNVSSYFGKSQGAWTSWAVEVR